MVNVARWRDRPGLAEIPPEVLAEWLRGDPDNMVGGWLDALYEQDQDAWADAFLALIAIPSYTPRRDG